MPDTQERVEATQADRDVAADLAYDTAGVTWEGAGRIRRGEEDHYLVRAFSAHRTRSTAELKAKLDMAVAALENPSTELLDACQEAADDYCQIDGDAGAWISSKGIEAVLKTVLATIKRGMVV